ncbi:folate-binding protein [Fulvimonas yonginensis]|uniref:Folate-binding protein n=1 Tax=Fulvimonas yonginensis TaxID=1495200 RepID=A0ABU8JFE7_9GAMM
MPGARSLAFRHVITHVPRMPNPYSAQLVSLEGADAIAFAQAQFSSNLAGLADGRWQFGAWLDAQGRVRALFHLLRVDEQRLRLLLRGGEAGAFAAALQRYVFRAKVRITTDVRAMGTGEPLALHTSDASKGTFALGCGSHSLVVGERDDDTWRLPQLRAGWPWLPASLLGELLPASLELGPLGATALDKGCYPGQEIVARLHYRGGNKRHLRHVQLSRPLTPGAVLREGDQVFAQLLDVVPVDGAAEALAVVHEGFTKNLHGGLHATHEAQPVHIRSAEHAPCTRERGR